MDKKQELFVSQIQRFSLHDGPGIRTTIFLICAVNGVIIQRHKI